jgi:hypothetical protein
MCPHFYKILTLPVVDSGEGIRKNYTQVQCFLAGGPWTAAGIQIVVSLILYTFYHNQENYYFSTSDIFHFLSVIK